jgi:hypothetical protein
MVGTDGIGFGTDFPLQFSVKGSPRDDDLFVSSRVRGYATFFFISSNCSFVSSPLAYRRRRISSGVSVPPDALDKPRAVAVRNRTTIPTAMRAQTASIVIHPVTIHPHPMPYPYGHIIQITSHASTAAVFP